MVKRKKDNYGVYACIDENGDYQYIGSTNLPLDQLEHNHRNARSLDYTMSDFRIALEDCDGWKFIWMLEPRNTLKEIIEIEEGALIRALHPKLNKKNLWGQYPYKASIDNQRYLPLT